MLELKDIKLVLKLVDFLGDFHLGLGDSVCFEEPSRTSLRLNNC